MLFVYTIDRWKQKIDINENEACQEKLNVDAAFKVNFKAMISNG